MPMTPPHELRIDARLDEAARQDFVSALRGFVLNDMASDMRRMYERDVKPAATRALGHEPSTSSEVHKAIRPNLYFKMYSAMRVNAQEMTWDSVRPQVEREAPKWRRKVAEARDKGLGSLHLKPALEIPRSVSAIDVHLMPGNYDQEFGTDDASQGILFDHGSAVFYMGLMGKDQGDIARSISRFVRAKYPDLQPKRILDLGCTIGQNTVPWAETYPEAEVHAIDVAAPVLRYAHARANALGRPVHFHQMNATDLDFEDESFDIVWSSMFWHEVPLKDIRKGFREAYRVLKPGGLMLHMELPPNKALDAYDGFYLDWDSWYNYEPFYKTFRDQDPKALCVEAGFDADRFEQHVVPSVNWFGEESTQQAAQKEGGIDQNTGRFANGISWYCFGAQKS
jgi:ubiquinone/menaquinone biosynthesis C-methylase UbiE